MHDLLLGHHMNLVGPSHGIGHKKRVAHTGVIGTVKRPALRQILLLDRFGGLE